MPVDDFGESGREKKGSNVSRRVVDGTEEHGGDGSSGGSGGSKRRRSDGGCREREEGDLDLTLKEAGLREEATFFAILLALRIAVVARTRSADPSKAEVDVLVLVGRQEEASADRGTVGYSFNNGVDGLSLVLGEEGCGILGHGVRDGALGGRRSGPNTASHDLAEKGCLSIS